MAVRIRLRRIGRKKQPSYRVVAAESTTPRSGAYLETLGFYNPRTNPAELRLDLGRVDFWLANGASLSQTAESLVKKARKGGDAKVKLMTSEPQAQIVAAPAAETPKPKARGGAKKAASAAPTVALPAAEAPAAEAPADAAVAEASPVEPTEPETPRGASEIAEPSPEAERATEAEPTEA